MLLAGALFLVHVVLFPLSSLLVDAPFGRSSKTAIPTIRSGLARVSRPGCELNTEDQ